VLHGDEEASIAKLRVGIEVLDGLHGHAEETVALSLVVQLTARSLGEELVLDLQDAHRLRSPRFDLLEARICQLGRRAMAIEPRNERFQ
jgi:hypothetical protein